MRPEVFCLRRQPNRDRHQHTMFASAFFWCAVACFLMLSVNLYGCDPVESETPPVFPYDQQSIEARVLQPVSSLARLTPDELADVVRNIESEFALPTLLIEAVQSVIADLEAAAVMASDEQSKTSQSQSGLTRVEQAITVRGNVNGWVELSVRCGDTPESLADDDGTIDLVVLVQITNSNGAFVPTGLAWGTATNCMLWDQDIDLRLSGDFALILPVSDNEPILYDMRGTQTTDMASRFEYAGYLIDEEVAWTYASGDFELVVGMTPSVYFIHDCSGRWVCDPSERRCSFEIVDSNRLRRSCPSPDMRMVTW